MRGFVATLSSGEDEEDKDYGIFAMDCEMCYTTIGNELTRVSVIDINGKTVYDAFVKPDNEIIDYNTRYDFNIVVSERWSLKFCLWLQIQRTDG